MDTQLTLYEELMLLALCEEKGTISGSYIGYAVAAAAIAELMLVERVTIDDGRRKYVHLRDATPSGDVVLDECITKIASAKKPKVLRTWVTKLASIKDLSHKVAKNLAAHGVVAANEEQILWLFSRRVYPEVNPEPEQQLRARMRAAVLDEATTVDARTVLMLALCKGAQLLPQVFSRKELRAHKKRIDSLVKGNLLGDATKEVIEAIQVAVMVAVMIPAITVTT